MVIGLLLLSNMVTAGVLYVAQEKKYEESIFQQTKQIGELKQQLSDVESRLSQVQQENEQLSKSLKAEIQLRELFDKSAPNQIHLATAKPGDKVHDMVVKSIEPYEKSKALTTGNVHVVLTGKITITGRYSYYDTGPLNALDGTVVFSDLDDSSKAKLPQIKGLKKRMFFVFRNQELAQELLGPRGSSGYATVSIDNYEIQNYSGQVWDTAELMKVIEKI